MGNRYDNEIRRRYPWLRHSSRWRKAGQGRWYKRNLSKARRQHGRRELQGLHPRKGYQMWTSEVNWRGT